MEKTIVSEKDKKQVLDSCGFKALEMSYANEDETVFLNEIKKGFNRKYKVFVWSFSGKLELEKYVKKFNKMVQDYAAFRSIYLYQGLEKPVKVIAEKPEKLFSITDIRKYDLDKMRVILRNAAAARTRSLYDPQTDFPIKISAYITSDTRMKIILCFYSAPGIPFASKGVRNAVFDGLNYEEEFSSMDENAINNINEAVVKNCKLYWKETLYPVQRGLGIPGISSKRSESGILSTVSMRLPEDMAFEIEKCASKNKVKLETIFLECWGELLGVANSHAEPVLVVKKHGEALRLCPVKIKGNKLIKDRWQQVDTQLENFKKNSGCSFEDLCRSASINSLECFYSLFEFHLDDSEGFLSYAEGNIAPVINIRTARVDKTFEISYSYDATLTMITAVKRLHDAYFTMLDGAIKGVGKTPGIWQQIIGDTTEDKELDNEVRTLFEKTFFTSDSIRREGARRDIERILQRSNVVSYADEDAIIEREKPSNRVGIILSGNVEERYINSANMVKTISVFVDGRILNLEGLSAGSLSTFSYYAVDDVVVLWILAKDLKAFMDKYPECWANTLEKVLKSANSMKKLWGLE